MSLQVTEHRAFNGCTGAMYHIVRVVVVNNGSKEAFITPLLFQAVTTQGRVIPQGSSGAPGVTALASVTLAKGQSVEGAVLFDTLDGATLATLTLKPFGFAESVSVAMPVPVGCSGAPLQAPALAAATVPAPTQAAVTQRPISTVGTAATQQPVRTTVPTPVPIAIPPGTGLLTLSPTSASLPGVGASQQFTASGVPTGSTVVWSVIGGCGAITSAGLFGGTAATSPTLPCSVLAVAGGLSASASVTVTPFATPAPLATPTSIAISPFRVTLRLGQTQQLTAIVKDQFGNAMVGQPVVWSASQDGGGPCFLGSINQSGLFSVPLTITPRFVSYECNVYAGLTLPNYGGSLSNLAIITVPY